MNTPAALDVVDVVKRYTADSAVGPISLQVRKGEFFSLLGESGSGKTTLLRCIAGFEVLSSGSISLNGEPIHAKPAHRRNVGLVFQNYALFPHRTVQENIAYGLTLRKVRPAEIAERVAQVLQLVGMPDLGERYPSQLSGGQQQRVAIARALVLEPPLILFDEPLSNLDAKLRAQLRVELRALQRRLQMTCVFVTHDQSEALALSDRIAVLSQGKVAQIGTPTEIYEAPANLLVAEFVGNSNRFPVEITHQDAGGTSVRTASGFELRSASARPSSGNGLTAMFRPELVRLLPEGAQAGPNTFECAVEDMTYLGEDTHVQLVCRCSNERFQATFKSFQRHAALDVGAPVVAQIDAAAVLLFEQERT